MTSLVRIAVQRSTLSDGPTLEPQTVRLFILQTDLPSPSHALSFHFHLGRSPSVTFQPATRHSAHMLRRQTSRIVVHVTSVPSPVGPLCPRPPPASSIWGHIQWTQTAEREKGEKRVERAKCFPCSFHFCLLSILFALAM